MVKVRQKTYTALCAIIVCDERESANCAIHIGRLRNLDAICTCYEMNSFEMIAHERIRRDLHYI